MKQPRQHRARRGFFVGSGCRSRPVRIDAGGVGGVFLARVDGMCYASVSGQAYLYLLGRTAMAKIHIYARDFTLNVQANLSRVSIPAHRSFAFEPMGDCTYMNPEDKGYVVGAGPQYTIDIEVSGDIQKITGTSLLVTLNDGVQWMELSDFVRKVEEHPDEYHVKRNPYEPDADRVNPSEPTARIGLTLYRVRIEQECVQRVASIRWKEVDIEADTWNAARLQAEYLGEKLSADDWQYTKKDDVDVTIADHSQLKVTKLSGQ
jgi:hypothetical protein